MIGRMNCPIKNENKIDSEVKSLSDYFLDT